jgi:molecular chaperone DnaK
MEELRLKRVAHPPFRPDIAPSDFFLFGWLKGELFSRPVSEINGLFEIVGNDWDKGLIDWLAGTFQKANEIDLRRDPMTAQRRKEEAEKAKIALSSAQQVDINLPFIPADANGPKHLNNSLTRSQSETICGDFY